jgi:hypothetical protein
VSFPIIGKRFTPDEFDAYVAVITLTNAFRPQFVVVHNTSAPMLSQRPNGFSAQNMEDLRDYYAVEQKWSGGPHLFVDDHGIWVFNPLDKRGTHAPSWNNTSWGVEMLGEYDSDSFTSGRGMAVRNNAVRAVATLCKKLNAPASSIRFHKEDPNTTHKDCPGKNVVKADFVGQVASLLAGPPSPLSPQWLVQFPGGERRTVDASQTGLVRWVAEQSGALVEVTGKVITITRAGVQASEA